MKQVTGRSGTICLAGLLLACSVPAGSGSAASVTASANAGVSGIEGRYYSESKPTEFIELRADGTAILSMAGTPATYVLDGHTVILRLQLTGVARGTWSSGRITFEQGGRDTIQQAFAGVWIRSAASVTASANAGVSGIEGRYYSESKPTEFIELRADGTAILSMAGTPATYVLDGQTVILRLQLTGVARGKWSSGRITFEQGGRDTIQQAFAGVWTRH